MRRLILSDPRTVWRSATLDPETNRLRFRWGRRPSTPVDGFAWTAGFPFSSRTPFALFVRDGRRYLLLDHELLVPDEKPNLAFSVSKVRFGVRRFQVHDGGACVFSIDYFPGFLGLFAQVTDPTFDQLDAEADDPFLWLVEMSKQPLWWTIFPRA